MRFTAWAGLVLLFGFVTLTLLTTTFKTDLSAFFMAGKSVEEKLFASEIQSGSLSKRYLITIGSDQHVPQPNFIATLITAFKQIEGVKDVWKSDETHRILKTLQTLYKHYPTQIYSRDPHINARVIFTPDNLHARAKALKTTLLSPQGALIKPLLKDDPLLLSLTGFKKLAAEFKSSFKKNKHYQTLILETEQSGLHFEVQRAIQQQINAIFNQHNSHVTPSMRLAMTGVAVFAVTTQQRMQEEITLISLVSSSALTLLFFILFKSFRVLLGVVCLLVIVVCSAVLMTQLVFGFVHGITLAIGTTLVGVCIDYPIHALIHGHHSSENQRLQSIRKIFPSMLMGGITTLIGYMALGISGYPGFQQVAVYSGTGIVVSLGLTRYLLPLFIQGIYFSPSKLTLATHWLNFCQRRRRLLVSLLILMTFSGLIFVKPLIWMQDLQELTPELNALKKTDQKIRSRMVSIEPGRFILVTGKNVEAVLQRGERVYQQLDQIKITGHLNDYFGVYPWLLSQQQQALNSERLQQQLTEKNRRQWHLALKSQGLSVEQLGTLHYTQEKRLTLDTLLTSPVARWITHHLIIQEQQVLLMIWLSQHDTDYLAHFFAEDEHIHYVSQRDILNQMALAYQHRAEIMLLAGLIFIALLLTVRYKSITKALKTLMPACLSALIMLEFWALQGVAMSFLHLVGFLLVIAICVDYGIFFQENRSRNIILTYQAMTVSMLTSAIAFGCLMLAETTLLRMLAQVVTGGVVLGFLLCPLIISTKNVRNT